MVGMNKKKERSQNAVSVKNQLFCSWGVLTVVQGPQIFPCKKFHFKKNLKPGPFYLKNSDEQFRQRWLRNSSAIPLLVDKDPTRQIDI